MESRQSASHNLASALESLESANVISLGELSDGICQDVAGAAFDALNQPLDFPALDDAIVSGDRIALAVDPNVPSLVEVIQGAIGAIAADKSVTIDVVLWDEASEETMETVRAEIDAQVNVLRHQSSDRGGLRYLAADDDADPVYFNRRLVDADVVLPIVASRSMAAQRGDDVAGIYPVFADSLTRERHAHKEARFGAGNNQASMDMTWLLGVHVMLSVTPNKSGGVAHVVAGTPAAIRRLQEATPKDVPKSALVIASLDGDRQQQTWCNAARAVVAASQAAEPDGTIVLWSEIDEAPRPGGVSTDTGFLTADESAQENGDGFPARDLTAEAVRTIERVSAGCRLIIRTALQGDEIESMGWGAIGSTEELVRFGNAFDSCSVLRAAQFAGTMVHTARELT